MKIRSVKLVKESFVQGVLKKINKIFRPGSASMDDFDWQRYHYHYQADLAETKKVHTQVLSPGDYVFSDGALSLQGNVLPLHPNHRLLYETILQLNPESVLELGCGGGDHLHNISILVKNAKLYGVDLSDEQLVLLRERHPNLNAVIN